MKTNQTPDITPANYEEYFLLSLDGELDAATEKSLFAFLDAHPALAAEVAGYEDTKIPLPPNTPVFDGKEALLKPEITLSKSRKLQPFLWSAAALLLVWIGVQTARQPGEKEAQTAVITTPKSPVIASPRPSLSAPVASTQNTPKTPLSSPQFPEKKSAVLPQKPAANLPIQEAIPSALPQESIATLPIVDNTAFPENVPSPAPPAVLAIALPTPAADPAGVEINIPALSSLRESVVERALALRDAHRNLKNTEATVSIGNRELFTIRF